MKPKSPYLRGGFIGTDQRKVDFRKYANQNREIYEKGL